MLVRKLNGSFDVFEKAALIHARNKDEMPYQTLMQGFGYNDQSMVITLLKLINQIIFNLQEDESTMAKFVARLETLGVYDLLERWG